MISSGVGYSISSRQHRQLAATERLNRRAGDQEIRRLVF